jgi:hypothetical protein
MDKYNKKIGYIFLLTCFAFLFFLYISEWEFITQTSYTVHELCTLLYQAFALSILIEVILIISIAVLNHKNLKLCTPSQWLLIACSIIVFICCIAIFVLSINKVSYTGFINKNDKFQIENKYYLKFNNKIVEISKEQYDLINDDLCFFEIEYNKLIKDSYKIIKLESDE